MTTLRCGARTLDLSSPVVMGVLNVTPDSFSDGGRFLPLEAAVAQGVRLAQEGADVVVDDRVIGESAQATVDAIAKLGRRAVAVQGDLANPADDRRVIAEGVEKLGKIDILVNNAGVERRADFWDVTKFPGKRGLRKGVIGNLEIALMADGVAPARSPATSGSR